MKPYTYRELRDAVNELSERQLDMTVAILDGTSLEVYDVLETYIVENMSTDLQDELLDCVSLNQPLLVIGKTL